MSSRDRELALSILANRYDLPVHDDSYWHVRFPVRAVNEIELMRNNTNASMGVYEDGLVFQELIKNNFENNFDIFILAGPDFPHLMPDVYIRRPRIEPSTDIHVHPDGRLCLMSPDDYLSSMNILKFRGLSCAWTICYNTFQESRVWPGAEKPH